MRQTFAVLVVTGLLFGALVAAVPAEPACGFAEPQERDWGSVRPLPPRRDGRTVSTGSEEYVGFSVGQRQGRQAAVADSRSIQVTRDAGCTWDDVFAFGDDVEVGGDIEPSTARFVDVVVSDRVEGDERIVGLVYDLEVVGQARVRTVVSDDGGRTFDVAGQGLPNSLVLSQNFSGGCGDDLGCLLAIAPSDPDVVYVMVEDADVSLFVSRDGGRTFRRQSSMVPFVSTEGSYGSPTTLAVAPDRAGTVWAGESFGSLLSSTDHGDTWAEYDVEDIVGERVDGVRSVAVAATDDGYEVVAIVEQGDRTWTLHTADEGRSWTAFPTGIELTDDVAGGSTSGAFIATTAEGAHRLDLEEQEWVPLGGESLGPLYDIHPLVNSTTVWFRGPGSLPVIGDLQFTPVLGQLGPDLELPEFDPLKPEGPLPGRLVIPDELIRLEVGQATSVPITLDLPLTRTPLDVFFLFDQSGSMSEEIDALARGMVQISNELLRRRVDLYVGLGGYSAGWRYQLHRDIGPPDREFRQALESMRTNGGIETVYTALHQVATGTGLEDSPAGFGPEPGWNAHWRHGAVRVVVNLTDEPFQVESKGPSKDVAIEALANERIRTASLISADQVPPGEPGTTSLDAAVEEDDYSFGDAAEVARLTGALAGPSGVDCGADGEVDIPPGEPLACFLSPLITAAEPAEQYDLLPNLADVVVEILDGVTEVHTVEFQSDVPDVVTALTPLDPVVVDIRDPQVIRVRATVTCPAHRAGTVIRPLVTAVASTRFLAADRMVVQCGPLPAGAAPAYDPVPPTVPQPAAVAAAPAPPAPPAPATVSAASTAGASSPAASSATMPQIGVAMAAQHERQVQTASIGGPPTPGLRPDPDLAFEYSARRDASPSPTLTLLAGAAMTAGAGALARRRRTAGRPGPVRVRR